ncbi:Mercuric reductase [Botrimarina colliarenosi]|uniref:Mercuric reductase n=1 Tax=Botrimarina colliarenosi TaxID=2528001 RepID=A0A5C6ALV6_9BACT|nr:mercuric reductase [Botrimarina colliarenosi]TWU00259.1 Mercuric reductase [Botrimarina colliarenosi]
MPSIELQPYDAHNQRLESHVHPLDWTNPTPSGPYDLVVIGAGTAGLVSAAVAAGLGAKVALVERHLMGGDCLNIGCVPSKGLLSAARAAHAVRRAGEFGVHVDGEVRVDFGQVMERMRRLRADISPADSARRFRDEKRVDVYLGAAEFTGGDAVRVADQTLRFKKGVLATGARAAAPPIAGLDRVAYLTNESVFSLTELPRSLGVIGAGPIGCELAQAFARFGSEVHLVNADPWVLPREDEDAAQIVQRSLEADGVRIYGHGKSVQLSPEGDRVRITAAGGEYNVVVDKLLVAVGRAPNVEGLGLERVGVEYDGKQGVKVNDYFQTTNPKVYAAGDICSPYKFTHAADFMARAVVANALFTPLGFGKRKASSLVIPWATYTSPELAHVGLTEKEAEAKGVAITTFRQDLEHVDRAILDGQTEGFVKIHVARGTDRIVGATIVAENAGDLIGSLSIAMTNGVGLGKIAASIHPYPTQAEAIRKVGDLYSRTKLTPFAAWFLKTMLRVST